MDEIAELLGVVSLVVVVAAVATAVLMRHRRARFHGIHRVLGYITLAMAIGHGLALMVD